MNIKKIKQEFSFSYELIEKEIKNIIKNWAMFKNEWEFLMATIYFSSKAIFREISLNNWKKFSSYANEIFLEINAKNNPLQTFDLDYWYLEIKKLIQELSISNHLLNEQLEQIYLKFLIFYWHNITIPKTYEIGDFSIVCLRNKALVDCMQILQEYYHINVDILIDLVIKQIK
ncbi:hypothetical protein [Ureaplasma urealyticum]|uniref:Uncharacterized protein n=3 Tax=Ureaplasma urealyticum TaxID=2130 RepID=A0AAP9AAA2_UREUR|nr:hypothetical protein [Ureaplasma urealyticum]EDX53779.1 conserved hypothetical protein [Ureaplasma urealyticum serovar 9 str. ATCC 33175]ACI60161.1 conserved hypothetical protein [Ureaplasma urealyticum serovar 10 str. ATCC 33699]EDT49454.1 conserved hypothetical protein [Ureaplasma urealyticum serovar 13 str. ATCC 33698]EDU06279.1 conserved hypothetical protein [Ureaplasma urealyticum serovar 5 str. ATCC 27817]EDU57140.1 conserved hypothetical protein [Ureaplasma urealyticum serovar 7 str.